MKNLFNSIAVLRPKTNYFDLSNEVKLSARMGELVPIYWEDCVPGDKFKISAQALVRMAPMIAPTMHRFDVSIHYFFVPYRLLWENWNKFITNTPLDGTNVLPAFPTLTIDVTSQSRLTDYLGIPPTVDGEANEIVSAMPMAAYQKIYDEYYRDQNLINSVWQPLNDGSNDTFGELFLRMRRRAWEHDYFTSALPFAQKGPAVEIPVQGDVVLKEDWADNLDRPEFIRSTGGTADGNIDQKLTIDGAYVDVGNQSTPSAYDPAGSLEVQNATTTINDLRRAYALQRWFEAAARGGSRLTEMIYSMFGVKSPDARLQRPEYITGVKSPMIIGEVLNTTGTDARPQGDMAGHGMAAVNGRKGSYYCQEHGIIMGIMSVMPKTAYQQGLHKFWLKTQSPFQFYFPQFANIGEQEVLNKEVYAFQGENGNETFGYNPRYSEYKYHNSRVAGEFRTTLNFWHAGRIFATPPALNQEFIECVPTKRFFAVEDQNIDELWISLYNDIGAVRPMPKYGTPTI